MTGAAIMGANREDMASLNVCCDKNSCYSGEFDKSWMLSVSSLEVWLDLERHVILSLVLLRFIISRVEIEIRALAGPDKVALFYLRPE